MPRKSPMSIQIYLEGGADQRRQIKDYAESKGLSVSKLVIEAINHMKATDAIKKEPNP